MLADDVVLPAAKPTGESASTASPVHSHQIAVTIDGVHTDVVYQMFSDKLLVIATQLAKMGTMISCEPDGLEECRGAGAGGKSDAVEVNCRVVLGDPNDPLLLVFASNLFKKLSPHIDGRSLLISIALKEKNIRALHALERVIIENRIT